MNFTGIAVGVVCSALTVIAVVALFRYGQRRTAELLQHAASLGWVVVARATLPPPLTAVIERRTVHKIWYRATPAGPEWCVWHWWTTSTGSGSDSKTENHNRTDFIAPVPGRPLPAVVVSRRSALGAAIIPVRGVGTGDAEFDRRFLVKPADAPAAAVIGPRLRALMLAGTVPPWRLGNNFVTVTVEAGKVPDKAVFDTWSGRAPALAALLAQG